MKQIKYNRKAVKNGTRNQKIQIVEILIGFYLMWNLFHKVYIMKQIL